MPAAFSGVCRNQTGWAPQFKAYGVYNVPKIAVQVSGTYRNTPGANQVANLVATNAYLAANSTLGRPLAGNAPNQTISIYNVNETYLDRRNELDLRVGKTLRYGRTRALISVDLFNAFNTNPVLTANSAYALANNAYLRPQSILNARLMKISLNLDF